MNDYRESLIAARERISALQAELAFSEKLAGEMAGRVASMRGALEERVDEPDTALARIRVQSDMQAHLDRLRLDLDAAIARAHTAERLARALRAERDAVLREQQHAARLESPWWVPLITVGAVALFTLELAAILVLL